MSAIQHFENAGNKLEKAILPVARGFNYAAMVGIFVLILLTSAEIFTRKLLNTSIPGANEVLALTLGAATCLMLAISEFGRGHISIDVLSRKLPPRGGAVLNAVMYLLFLMFTLFVAYAMFEFGRLNMHTGKVTLRLHIIQYPFYYEMALCFLILSLMVLAHFILYIAEALKK